MSVTAIKFTVREDDRDFPVCDMSEPECAAIEECVEDLIPYTFKNAESFWFETDTCFAGEDDDEEMVEYGKLRCYTHNPNPQNGSLLESRLPFSFPSELLEQLGGKTFRVHPRQLGVNPWGTKIEIVFQDLAPKKPTSGVKASDLIAAALKAN